MSQLGQFNSLYGTVDSITGNDGIAITPLIGNVDLLGAAPFTVTGVLATATLTISSDGSIAITYTTDAGNAVAALDTLNVLGGNHIATAGAGDTVTINLMPEIADTFVTNAGTAEADLGVLKVLVHVL